MSAWVVLATCGPAATVSVLWIARIRHPKPQPAQPYTPPPITDEYVNAEIAVLEWRYHQEPTP